MRPGSDAASMREWFISVILLLPAQPHIRGSVREARMCWPCGGSALYSTARPAKLWFWKLRSRPDVSLAMGTHVMGYAWVQVAAGGPAQHAGRGGAHWCFEAALRAVAEAVVP